jgi:hypothetical protein
MFRMLISALALAFAIVAVSYLVGPRGQTNNPTIARADEPVPPARAPGEVAFEIDEATLTRQMNTAVSGLAFNDTPIGSAIVRDLAVQFRSGRFEANGTAQVGPTSLPLSLGGTIQAQDGRPVVGLSDARIGIVQLPQSSRLAVEQLLQGQLDQLLARQPMRVRSVTLGNGKLTVIGAPG